MFIRSFFSLFCCTLGCFSVLAATPEVMTQGCAQCHGADGVSTVAKTPHLNGQLAEYLEDTMNALVQGGRQSGIKDHVPKNWTAPEISAISRFYALSKGVRPVQTIKPESAAKGRQIYIKRCVDCHPDNGRQSEHDAPLMAAQNLDYLIEEVQAFISGKRKFVFMMDDAFRGLSAAELESVAHFFASQHQYKK